MPTADATTKTTPSNRDGVGGGHEDAYMWSPHLHAADLGIEVIYADIDELGRYYPGRGLVMLQRNLHTVVERCTLAHELGHHHRGASEDRADQWAADFLLGTEQVVQCALEYPNNPELWAVHLDVVPRVLKIWLSDPAHFSNAECLYQQLIESREP